MEWLEFKVTAANDVALFLCQLDSLLADFNLLASALTIPLRCVFFIACYKAHEIS